MSLSVPSAEFESRYRHGLSHAARHVRLKGFRPGKVPGHMVEKSFGEEVRRETLQHFLQLAYRRAVEEHELQPAVHPRIEIDQLEVLAGSDFDHSFELHLRPELELGEYRGLIIEGESLAVDEDEIDRSIEDLRQQRATPEPVGEEGLPEDGLALCTITLVHEGRDLVTREKLRVSPKTPMSGVDPEAFQAALTGAQTGDERELPFTFPEGLEIEGFEEGQLVGQQGTARIRVDEALRLVPAADEELFQLFEVEDDDGLRDRVAAEIAKAKEERENQRVETTLLSRVIEEHPMELPEGLVREQAEARIQSARAQLEEQGTPAEEIEQQLEGEAEAAYEAAARSMRALFLIQAIAKEENLEVKPEDMNRELSDIARRNQASLEEVQQYYKEEGLFEQLNLELSERKVRTFLRESADVQRPD